ncbi:ROK family protein [Tautonia plasticadhaerens]|uniref:Glucokinase n=1 Tax=Tautonia plasticadhaerens TaxID=2527974 RepID=A0A518H915_9BACT|nr:ROK family protein [Tautonia plasticadhaerens]QDV37226.1 Glucokinase [Tautonia plasticadhaerens]
MTTPAEGSLVLGIDLGGTKILAGVVDDQHRIVGRAKESTPAREGPEALREALVSAGRDALQVAGIGPERLSAIGIGSPGPLDVDAGVIRSSPNLNVTDFPLKGTLEEAFGTPVAVQNDVRVGGYGEFKLGAGRGYRDVLAAFVGTGIGGCLIRDGRIVTGVTGNAGEIGHLIVKADGPKCGCGRKGCLEAVASRTAITRRVYKAIKKGASTPLRDVVKSKTSRLKSKELSGAYRSGDPVAVHEVDRAARFLGLALGGLMNVLGPEIIIVGGGVTEALGGPFVDLVRNAARAQAMADPDRLVRIEQAELGDDSGLLGAALIARERFVGTGEPQRT